MIGSLIYSLVIGWKLTLVYLSISPLIVLMFNVTIKVMTDVEDMIAIVSL